MADYKEKFDELHRAAKQKARELDEKLGVSGIVEEGARGPQPLELVVGKHRGALYEVGLRDFVIGVG